MIQEITGRLINRIQRTPTVESFRFMMKQKVTFQPGQFLQVLFNQQNKNDKELNKYLSFSSSPSKEYVEVTKRISGSIFSQRLSGLRSGDEVLFRLPLGQCVYKDEYKKIAFLVGGIGITPAISITEYIMDKKLLTDICLLYSNRTEEEIAFNQELQQWQSINKRVRVINTITECAPQDTTCYYGYIDQSLVKTTVPDITERMVFIFGPPRMTEAMKHVAQEVGCKPDMVMTESFLGY